MSLSPTTLTPHQSGDTWRGLSATVNINGSPMNLTGCRIDMVMRKTRGDVHTWSTHDAPPTIQIISAPAGTFSVDARVISGTVALQFDLQVTDATGVVRTIAYGTLPLLAEVAHV